MAGQCSQGEVTLEAVGWSSVREGMCALCDVWVILGAVQRGAISRLLAKISEAEAMMHQVCTCVFVHVFVWCGGGGCVGVCVCVCTFNTCMVLCSLHVCSLMCQIQCMCVLPIIS